MRTASPCRRIPALALFVLLSQSALADEYRPAYLQLSEVQPGTFEVLWKLPARGGRPLDLRVRFATEVEATVSRSTPVRGALIERFTVQSKQGLAGGVIAIDGDFSDWGTATAVDATGEFSPLNTDFASLWIASDANYFYVRVRTVAPVDWSLGANRLYIDTGATESNGTPVDLVIPTKFPSFLVRHPAKVAWLFHQHREAYDLWGTEYCSFGDTPEDRQVRDAIQTMDTAEIGAPSIQPPPHRRRSSVDFPARFRWSRLAPGAIPIHDRAWWAIAPTSPGATSPTLTTSTSAPSPSGCPARADRRRPGFAARPGAVRTPGLVAVPEVEVPDDEAPHALPAALVRVAGGTCR